MAAQETIGDGAQAVAAPPPGTEAAKNQNLVRRFVTAVSLIPFVLFLVYLGGLPFATFIGVVGAICALELCAMAIGNSPLRWLAAGAAFSAPFFFAVPELGARHLHFLWLGVTVLALTWRLLMDAPVETAGRDVSVTVLATIYASLIAYLIPLRALGPAHLWVGAGYVILVISMSWMSDTGAYFFGRFFGKHRLYPRISPSKTWEGFFGGMLSAIFGAVVGKWLAFHQLPWLDCVALGILAGIAGPLGDLSESMLKRAYHAKDSGQLLPGHGGMLDRVDALVFETLVVYGYYHFVIAGRVPPLLLS